MSAPVLSRHQDFSAFDEQWDPGEGRQGMPTERASGPPFFAVLAFWAFVLGGLAFGGVFLMNWKTLLARPDVAVGVPGAGRVAVGGLPLGGGKSGGLRSGLAGAAINLLPEWKGTSRINIVLLGIDKRQDQQVEGTRTDTIMLVSIDPVGKSVAMVSLPRDLWVRIPPDPKVGWQGGEQRINVAHALGGPDLTMKTITADFGVPVQYYARVDFSGFEELVNAVGGIIVDVDRPVKDDEYPTPDYGYQRVYVPPGPQLLDGRTALHYARSRHGTSDFDRARRQQRVIVAMRERVLQLNMLPRAPEMIGILQKAVSTDLSPTQILALARLASEIKRDHIANLVIDTEFATPFVGDGGADLLRPNTPAIRQAIDNALRAASRPELRARIEVLNGSGRPGLAQQAADVLTAQGFDVVRIAVADRSDYTTSTIQVLTGNQDSAQAVGTALRIPASAVVDRPSANPQADVRVILGSDFQLPPPRR